MPTDGAGQTACSQSGDARTQSSMRPNTKICEGCGEKFFRPTGTHRISDQRWEDRRNCSARCAFYHADAKGGPMMHTYDATQANAYLSCRAHLKALLRYGLNNDGLPGLPANDLLRLAAELGVAA